MNITFNKGFSIPSIGLGTWQITDRSTLVNTIKSAYDIGYRLFDIAAAYGNEISFGKAIKEASIPRDEIFIQDKAWNTCRGYEKVQEACKSSLKKLKTDYLDLYLIHWPASKKLYENWAEINNETWRGMEKLYKEGFVRAIGVCNFKDTHLKELQIHSSIKPFVNQIEFHPGVVEWNLQALEYCRKENILVQASSPLGNGEILNNKVIIEIAKEKGKSQAQICLRYCIEKGISVIPKTTSVDRLKENLDIFDFKLSDDEMNRLDKLSNIGGLNIDPDEVEDFG